MTSVALPAGLATPARRMTAIVLACLVSALGGLLFGYDWVVIGGAKPFYEAAFAMTRPAQQAWAVSCALIGCLIGAAAAGPLSDRIGRKPVLLAAAVIFVVSGVLTALASGYGSFVAYRVMGGLAIGTASGISPLYIAEIAPADSRGKLVCLNQLAIVIGVLAAQLANLAIAEPVPPGAGLGDIARSWNGTTGWRWMFGVEAIPALVFFLGLLFIPESPRWLARRGRRADAHRVLSRFGDEQWVGASLATYEAGPDEGAPGVRALFASRPARKALLVGIVLAVLQQWCGINVIFNYAQEVFSSAGYTVSDTLFNIVITGVVNLIFTVIAIYTVERLGRRALLIFGCVGLASIYLLLGGSYLLGLTGWPMLLMVVSAIAIYAMTLAPVTWVALSEIFPSHARGTCMALATTALWIACFILTYTFPLLNSALGTGVVFWMYALVCVAGGAYIYAALPETRGKGLEQIERDWLQRRS